MMETAAKPKTTQAIAREAASSVGIDPITRLRADTRDAAKLLTPTEVRFLVDQYYVIQEYRKASGNQILAMSKSDEPVTLLGWLFGTLESCETEIKRWLDIYTDHEATGMGAWSKSIVGIGPVISSGLLAHIDISRIQTAGQLWRFAGLDPTREWKKGEKRPFNASLKTLCWKIGQSFMKVQANKNDYYGKLYAQRKQEEIRKNEAGDFADQASAKLKKFNIGKTTDAYKAYSVGKLPPAHIDARARRWVVKLFLSHWFEEAYRRHHGKEPPAPYPIAQLGHAHSIEAPNGSNHSLQEDHTT